MTHFDYFAYGSNMLSARLRARTPSAVALGPALLHGHSLCWHKLGRDGSGKCDIVPARQAGDAVHGVLYRIERADKPRLDAAEGLGVDYAEVDILVELGTSLQRALAYVALRTEPAAVPFDWYKALVVAGAQEHGLPSQHLARLQAVVSMSDPDHRRSRQHTELITGCGSAR